jgi:hypothetical protein
MSPARDTQSLAIGAERALTLARYAILALLILCMALPLLFIQPAVRMVSTSYAIGDLRKEREVMVARNEQLRLELARAQSHKWVAHEAVNRLQMQPGSDSPIVRVDVPPPSIGRGRQTPGREADAPSAAQSSQPAGGVDNGPR